MYIVEEHRESKTKKTKKNKIAYYYIFRSQELKTTEIAICMCISHAIAKEVESQNELERERGKEMRIGVNRYSQTDRLTRYNDDGSYF